MAAEHGLVSLGIPQGRDRPWKLPRPRQLLLCAAGTLVAMLFPIGQVAATQLESAAMTQHPAVTQAITPTPTATPPAATSVSVAPPRFEPGWAAAAAALPTTATATPSPTATVGTQAPPTAVPAVTSSGSQAVLVAGDGGVATDAAIANAQTRQAAGFDPAAATDAIGPFVGGAPGPNSTPSAFSNDKLTNIAKVPGAQWIDWPAYTPAPQVAPVPTLQGTGVFMWPTRGWISTPFQPSHQAIDIAAPLGQQVVAADSGTVVFAGIDYGGLGYCVEIDHGNGYVTTYGHSSRLLVQPGDVVARGQLIMLLGSTGHSTGPHVHFVIKHNGQTVNPLNYLNSNAGAAPPPQVQAPDFTNMPPAKASQMAQLYHLTLKAVGQAASTTAAAGSLFGQTPPPGTRITVGSVVDVQISTGPPTPTATSTATVTATATPTNATGGGRNTQQGAQAGFSARPAATASARTIAPSPTSSSAPRNLGPTSGVITTNAALPLVTSTSSRVGPGSAVLTPLPAGRPTVAPPTPTHVTLMMPSPTAKR